MSLYMFVFIPLLLVLVSATGTEFLCTEDLQPSNPPPSSVHQLRPADVKVIGAVGDSITAGVFAGGVGGNGVGEARGLSWSAGGFYDGDDIERNGTYPLTTEVTLPNVLMQFNPKLYGYAIGSGPAAGQVARLNQAISGAVAEGIPSQVETLIARMKQDPNVDFENDWKVVTIWIGGNDLCAVCRSESNQIRYSPTNYINHLRNSLSFLQSGMPRVLVNLVSMLNVAQLDQVQGPSCDLDLCTCAKQEYEDIVVQNQKGYNQGMRELVMEEQWFKTEDFTVVYQPFLEEVGVPLNPVTGRPDRTYFAADCFHFSLKGQDAMGMGLWNNMMQAPDKKETAWTLGEDMLCPTNSMPYIPTYINSPPSNWRLREKNVSGEFFANLKPLKKMLQK